jgi:hypothetical protein
MRRDWQVPAFGDEIESVIAFVPARRALLLQMLHSVRNEPADRRDRLQHAVPMVLDEHRAGNRILTSGVHR